MPERECDLELARVVPAVAHEQALAVPHVRVLAREVEVRGAVGEAHRDRLGETARGVHGAVEHVGDRAAAGLAEQPALDDRGHPRREVRQAHDAAVREHDHRAGVRGDHRVGECELRGGQLDVIAVEALGLERCGHAEEEQHGLRSGCRGHRLGHELVGDRTVVAVAGRERHLCAGERPDLVERVVETRRVDLRRPGALVARRAGQLADDGHGCPGGDRQHGVVVLQQHDRRAGDLAGERVVNVGVVRGIRPGSAHRLLHELDVAARGRVEQPLVEHARAHCCDELGIGAALARRHLEVEAGGEAGDALVHRAPVRDDEAVEAPLVAEHLREEPGVL